MLDVNDPARLSTTGSNTVRIAQLNDDARRHLNCNVVATPGFRALPPHTRRALLEQLVTFDKFDGDNDPHGERDFGKLTADGVEAFWKIDYYDLALSAASPDPANPAITARVLTLMLVSEY